MPMTEMQATKALLEGNWEKMISGRATDVPEPTVVLQQNVSQSDLKTTDYARVVDGGGSSFTPRGFGWTHRKVEADISVELRTADRRVDGGTKVDGHARMFGDRPGTSEPDRYTGLTGEVRRILDAHRKGFAEFDLVVASDFSNESAAEGKNYYRADVDIAFIQHAKSIDPAP